jgi:hypothetical protein
MSITLRSFVLVLVLTAWALPAQAAYHHMGEIDSDIFLSVYPAKNGTKLDGCALCHTGGTYEKSPGSGKFVTVGSCQWCHRVYGYDGSGDILETLNPYGLDYLNQGRSAAAVSAIEGLDSDGDGFTNLVEVEDLSYPGNAADDPTKVPAPARIVSLDELKRLPAHSQFMVMNTHKSGDFYANYTGAVVEDLLVMAGRDDGVTGVTVYAPDGYSQFHPMDATQGSPNTLYPILGVYPQATYYYDAQADQALSEVGWCDYSAPSNAGRVAGEAIVVEGGLRCILAYERDGQPLTTGELTTDNKLDGEGPLRMLPPQVEVNPPDQASTATDQDVIWPFTDAWDHNAGFSTRSVTIMRVEPLPAGTTDVDVYEAGWEYVDAGKILVYGAIDPAAATLLTAKGDEGLAVNAGQLTNVELKPLAELPGAGAGKPKHRDCPYEAASATVLELAEGGTTTLSLTFPKAVPGGSRYFLVDAAGAWTPIAFAKTDDAKTITLTLTDGTASDLDGVANGQVQHLGVLALENDDGGSGGCAMAPGADFGPEWLFLLGLPLLWRLRRRA